jgi:probable metal-binding protein
MKDSIHGHELLHLVLNAGTPVTRSEMAEHFGEESLFHTCSARNMSLDQLIDFLTQRGKITRVDGGYLAHRESMCSHD